MFLRFDTLMYYVLIISYAPYFVNVFSYFSLFHNQKRPFRSVFLKLD